MKKIFEVDLSSVDDIKRTINTLKSNLGELTKISSRSKFRARLDACQSILETDISSLYTIELDETPKFYVYAHCDPSNKIAIGKNSTTTFGATLGLTYFPFYIGKGTGDRAWDLNRNESHKKMRQKIKTFGNDIDVKIIKSGLTEKEALMLEVKLIDVFGLTSFKGMLVNLDEGTNNKTRHQLYAEQLRLLNNFYKNSV